MWMAGVEIKSRGVARNASESASGVSPQLDAFAIFPMVVFFLILTFAPTYPFMDMLENTVNY